jgi:hypothetical protein
MNQKMDIDKGKSALTPDLSPGERGKRSQRIGKMWRCWFKGSMREFFGEISP